MAFLGISLLWWGIGVIAVIVLALVLIFNGLIVTRNRVKNSWSQIDVQLQKRNDLVPNLVETVKGYAKHERETFSMVTQARTAMVNAKSVPEKAKASDLLTGALKSLFAVAEAYPDLKASANFLNLQEQLTGVEEKIAYSRQFYNDSVLDFNNSIQVFPNRLFAGLMGFSQEEFFESEAVAKKVPKVSFP
ncbi:MAG TPA: LemA family protein [Candidatus Diapherotrites archaeon]|uniref:LemA family protein n=1 Tax=Candidatus Iainarchaeum sp. TaxID=3101447 RepID=A0A7J4KTR0_9ARCH|nr:LemA family protein [Candidatus Diapherotrites archaeon]